MNNEAKYSEIFVKLFNVNVSELNDDFSFKKIEQWDSLTHMSLISMLEDEFDVFFDTEDILNFGSYTNGMKILNKYGVDI